MGDSIGSDELNEYVGKVTSRGTVVVERAALTNFAKAVCDTNPVYRNSDDAAEAGFTDIPAPPTFAFSIQNWGKWEELQPDDPTPDGNPMADLFVKLMSNGGLVLHGEQEFQYHRPVTVGQRLDFEGVVKDVYQKASGERTMTFMVIEDTYRDADGVVLTSVMNLLHRS